ncbi:unnamed protein product, partial [Gongylonema pulchrum]|uniref:Uncharacterized protein n=1 Tax=Gongylonema pulchrum TaxID=637853 RepID=A0A183DCX7_9BILA
MLKDSNPSLESVLHGSLYDCYPDQLQAIAVELFALLTRATHLIDVRTVALETFAHDNSSAAQSYPPSEAKCARLKGEEVPQSYTATSAIEEVILQPQFTLDDAVAHFILFCIPPVPKLQVFNAYFPFVFAEL